MNVIFDVFPKRKGIYTLEGVLVEKGVSKFDSIDFATREIFFKHLFFVK